MTALTNQSKVFPHLIIITNDNTVFPPHLFICYTTPRYKAVYAVPATAFSSDEDIPKWIGTVVMSNTVKRF